MKKRLYFYVGFVALAIIYISTSLAAPLGPTRYNLTPAKTHVLQLSIYLPLVLIWAAAVHGAERFKSYTNNIRSDEDGKALDKVSTGFIILVSSIIINGMFGVLRPWALADHWLSAFTIASNFIAAFLPTVAYSFMYSGSRQLKKIIKRPKPIDNKIKAAVFGFLLVVAIIYIKTLLSYKYRQSTPDPSRYSSFYMSSPLIFLTLALPYLIGWGLSMLSVLNLIEYRRRVKGKLYQQALIRLIVGIIAVLAFYIVIQMLTAFSTYIARAGLSSILLILYLLIILYASGFLIIASGAKKLHKIEKVK